MLIIYLMLMLVPSPLLDLLLIIIIQCICFHPNSNYLATGCSDRVIRIIDIASKQDNPIIRQLTGHKVCLPLPQHFHSVFKVYLFLNQNSINIVKFSYCGRYLASGGQDGYVYLWDVATPVIVAQFNTHKDSIYSLDFSRDNTVLVSSKLSYRLIYTLQR